MYNKKIIRCFAFLLLSIFLISFASAGIEFNETVGDYGEYKIDSFLPSWLGGGDKAEIRLLDNTDQCLINCKATIAGYFYKERSLMDEIKFLNRKGNEVILKDLKFRIAQWEDVEYEIPIYEEICEEKISINGTYYNECSKDLVRTDIETKQEFIWREYKGEEIIGYYQLEISAKKNPKQRVDWIITVFGEELIQWAWWNTNWNFKREISGLDGNISALQFINFDSGMKSDFSDLRFLDFSTESVELNYTIEKKVDSDYALIRINNLGKSNVYMYYGNAGASSNSDSSKVFYDPRAGYFLDGNVIDFIGIFNGTNNGATTNVSGIINSSYSFTNNDYIDLGNIITGTTGTVSLWFKTTDSTSTQLVIYSRWSNTQSERIAIRIGSGNLEVYVGTDGNWRNAQSSVSDGNWHNVVLHFTSSDFDVFYDGTQTITAHATSISSSSNGDDIGKFSDRAAGYFEGSIDEVYLYNEVITENQIKSLAGQTQPNFILGSEQQQSGFNTELLNPLDNFLSIVPQINFSVNSLSITFTQIDNVTLYVWNEDNFSELITNFTSLDSNTSVVTNWTNNLEEGIYIWNAETCGESVNCTFANTNRTLLVHFTAPTINISSPDGLLDYFILGDNETLLYNISEIVENTTEHFVECWFEYNNTEVLSNSSGIFDGSTQIFNFPTGYANVTKLIAINSSFEFTNINESCSRRGNFTVRAILNGSNRDLYCLNQFTQDVFIGTVTSSVITVINITSMEKRSLNCTGNSTSFEYVEDENSLCVHAIDEFGLHSENITEWDYELLEINQSFNSPVVEASNQEFEMFAKINGSITAINFIYNNLSFPANIFNLGNGLTRIVSSFQIPSFDIDTNVTNNFNVTMQSGTNILTQNQTQEVLILIIGNCTSFSNLLFNLSLFEEKLLTPLVGTIEADIEILNIDGVTEISTKSTQFYNVQNTSICSNLNFSGTDNLYNLELRYYVDPLNNSNFQYVPEFYHIQKAEINNLPMQVDLYDLNVNESTEFTIFYRDNDYIAEEDILLQIQRKYVDEGIFRVIEIPITSSQGSAVAHFDLNNYKYKITATKDGVVENVFPNPAIRCESELSGICEIFLKGLAEVPQADFTSDLVNFFYTLEQTNDSVIVSYVIPSGESENVRVLMIQESPFKDDTIICNTTILSSAGQIECNVNETIGDSNVIVRIESNDDTKGNLKVTFQEDLNSAFLLNNYFIAIVLLMTIVMMVVSSPQLMVLASVFGLTFSGIVFLLKYETIGLAAGAISWLIVVGIIILVKLNKKAEQ